MTQVSCDSPSTVPSLLDASCERQAHIAPRLALVFGLWIAVAVLYWPGALKLNRLWLDAGRETYTHGYLILLICLWLVVRDRHRLAAAPARPVPVALIPLLLLSAAWVWSWRAAIQEPQMMLLPLILLTAVVTTLGTAAARVLAFPIGYLYFAFPFWSDGNFILQAVSARMTGGLLWLTGVPAYMQGNFIHLPRGTIHIANGCSGLHSFIVGVALAALYGKLVGLPRRRWLIALAVMGGVSMIVNWVRIFIVTVAAYTTDMHSSLVRDHYWLGWWLFALAFAGFLWWMGREPAPRDVSPAAPRAGASAAAKRPPWPRINLPGSVGTIGAVAALLVITVAYATGGRDALFRTDYWVGWSVCTLAIGGILWWIGRKRKSSNHSPAAQGAPQAAERAFTQGINASQLLATLVALSLLPATSYGMDWARSSISPPIAIAWPPAPRGWRGPAPVHGSAWQPYFVRPGGQSLRDYINSGGKTVQVFAVAYRVQTQHAKLLGYSNRLLGRNHSLRRESDRVVHSSTGPWLQTQVIDASGTRSVIWSRYRVGHRIFIDPRLSQLWYGLAAVLHVDPPISSLMALRASCRPDCQAARARLAAAAALQPTLR